MYEERGCITIRYTPPIHCLALHREETRPLAERLASLLDEMCIAESPVFVHAFGNNGAGMYQYLKEELIRAGAGGRLGGVVFDSGPGKVDIKYSPLTDLYLVDMSTSEELHTLYQSIPGTPLYRIAAAALFFLLAAVTWLVKKMANILCFPVSPPPPSPAQFVASEQFPPALFIFSSADHGADNIAVSRQKSGGLVGVVKYEDTHHRQHLRDHRESYINALVNFLHDCMGQ